MKMNRNALCRILSGCFICLLLVGVLAVPTMATDAFPTYVYNSREQAVPTAKAYEVVKTIGIRDLKNEEYPDGIPDELGGKELINPSDFYVDKNNDLYIFDWENSRVVVMNSDLTLKKVIKLTEDRVVGEEVIVLDVVLAQGDGIFVDDEGLIYLCASDDNMVCIFNQDGKMVDKILIPDSPILPEKFNYRPIKAEIDSGGIMYVLSKGCATGAMQFDSKGQFMGFYGGEDVDITFDVLLSYFWKSIMSDAAVEGMERSVSVEFNSFCIDHKDFVFTIRKGTETNSGQVRKLNAKGDNVLDPEKRFGDYVGKTQLTDIVVDDDGFITAIDLETGHIMQYDQDGQMLYAFGGKGSTEGAFYTIQSIESIGKNLIVLDKGTGLITVFEPTDFANNVREATLLYSDGKYDEAKPLWEKVLASDNNYELANLGMGKIYEGLGEYKTAMEYYKKGNNKEFYSEAFEKYRADLLRENFAVLMIVIVLVIAVPLVMLSRKPKVKEVYAGGRPKGKYPFYCMFHPLNGYDDLKAENSGSFWRANMILLAMFIVAILSHQLTGFAYNMNRVEQLNIWVSLFSTVGVFVAFVVCNWAVTTIMDGKGKLLEIWTFCAYALLPLVLGNAALIVCSNVLTLEESAFYYALQAVVYGWAAIGMLIAIREVHMYSLKKTIGTLLITFFGLMVVVVIVAIVYSVFSQLIGFISTVWSEISMRI